MTIPGNHDDAPAATQGSPGIGASGLILDEPLLWERGRYGRTAVDLPPSGVPSRPLTGPRAGDGPDWPDLSELEVVRHFTRLSSWNFGVDTGMYPLGSCTMKYNPKVNETVAAMPGFTGAHPLLPDDACQGALAVMHKTETLLAAITGLEAASLQPAAGAHGELCGMLMIAAYHQHHNTGKTAVLIPDTAHGTNPATAAMCGFTEVKVPVGPDGRMEPETVRKLIDDTTAGIMVTNPNTLGIFETHLPEISRMIHDAGGLVYADGANLNAIMGRIDIGKMGVDVLHFNLHKSMSTPHGGGGPGSGPVAVAASLVPYLPGPRVVSEDGRYRLEDGSPLSIGRLHPFHGQFGIYLRAYAYLLTIGSSLRDVSGLAVLNANYLRARLREFYDLPYDTDSMHEAVFTDAKQRGHKVTTLDIAKRLIDLGYHPPTIYFPLVVNGALMIEPTETECKEELDGFAEAMIAIAREAETDPDRLHQAPVRTKVGRLDETLAARKPKLTGD